MYETFTPKGIDYLIITGQNIAPEQEIRAVVALGLPPFPTHFAHKEEECMKVLVTAKRVVDYNVNIRVLNDNSGVDLNNVKMSVNPFDEIAIEEAVRLKEAGNAEEIIVVSIGTVSYTHLTLPTSDLV